MSQTETTSIPQTSGVSSEAIFLIETQRQALAVLERNHGGLITAVGAVARNFIEGLTHKGVDTLDAARVIEARRLFNTKTTAITGTPPPKEIQQEINTKISSSHASNDEMYNKAA